LNPPDEQFTVSAAESYRATGDIVVDGEVKLAFEAVETATGERYLVVEEPGVRSEHYQSSPNASVYERIAVEHGDAERLRGEITGDEDRRLLWKNRTRERVVFVVEENTTDLSRSLTGPASVVVRSLHVASYESGGDSSNASVYEPRNGWYDGTDQPVRHCPTDIHHLVRICRGVTRTGPAGMGHRNATPGIAGIHAFRLSR
jgi:hypothetical protein